MIWLRRQTAELDSISFIQGDFRLDFAYCCDILICNLIEINSLHLSRNPFQRPQSSYFDSRHAHKMPPVTQKIIFWKPPMAHKSLADFFLRPMRCRHRRKLTNDRERNHAQEDVDSYQVQNKNKFREGGLFYFFSLIGTHWVPCTSLFFSLTSTGKQTFLLNTKL